MLQVVVMDEAEVVPLCFMKPELSGYMIAFENAQEPEAGVVEEARYDNSVWGLERLSPRTLVKYGALLDEIAAWGEQHGFFGDDYGVGQVRKDFNTMFGHRFMGLEYVGGSQLEGSGGLL
jgi:hypothetical protein